MNMVNRRKFVITLLAGSTAFGVSQLAAQTKVDEKDPQAAALGYVAESKKVDSKKFPKHTPDQKCTNCQLYAGKATDPYGGCPIFAGKQVAGPGWCSAWVKKA
jgi:High potential iron-sulfur protein